AVIPPPVVAVAVITPLVVAGGVIVIGDGGEARRDRTDPWFRRRRCHCQGGRSQQRAEQRDPKRGVAQSTARRSGSRHDRSPIRNTIRVSRIIHRPYPLTNYKPQVEVRAKTCAPEKSSDDVPVSPCEEAADTPRPPSGQSVRVSRSA